MINQEEKTNLEPKPKRAKSNDYKPDRVRKALLLDNDWMKTRSPNINCQFSLKTEPKDTVVSTLKLYLKAFSNLELLTLRLN